MNDTDKAINLPTQDSNLYLKQEVRENGKWGAFSLSSLQRLREQLSELGIASS